MTLADVEFTAHDRTLIGLVKGEVDMSNAETIGTAVVGRMAAETAGVVLDLSAVDYLDSAGIYVLFGLRERLRVRGHPLILVVPEASPVNDALRLAGVRGQTVVAGSLEEALGGLPPAGGQGAVG
jgi:anti-sigma B factor antagonist